uniref:Enhancer of mRNA decapping 4 n=1 Tax=Fundulus heteroclitus TaxID=8078 RepID=A0A3Q2QAW7_FUNHE
MASNTNIDIEGATQHLRDILKLDRPGSGAGKCVCSDPGPHRSSSACVGLFSRRQETTVKIQPVAKYDWEHKYYYGRLIAVSNSFLAYAIRGANNHAMVRVLSLDCGERSLLKGFTGAVTDLAFAHLDSSLLGCVDEAGNLMVWQLELTGSKILDQIVVHIQRPDDTPLNSHRRLIWCPFILDDSEENQDDPSQTLALLHEDRVEVWDVELLRANNSSWPVDATDLKEGLITIKGHTQVSGSVPLFYTAPHRERNKQIYQRRIMKAVIGLSLTSNPTAAAESRSVLGTGHSADANASLSSSSSHRFSPDPLNSTVPPSLKASLDLSAGYLILTDVQRKVLYVMELQQDLDNGKARFTAVSEFLLTHPVLSFGVRDVTQCRLRHTEVLTAEEESESMSTEGTQGPAESKSGIQIKLYCVHTNSLSVSVQHRLTSLIRFLYFNVSAAFSDHLTDQSSDKDSTSGSQSDLRKIPSLPAPSDFLSNSGPASGPMPKLMTPDAFMTPSTSVFISYGGLASPGGPLALDSPHVPDSPLLPPLASPTRARSPDVISSASTMMSQDMPEIATQTLQLQRGHGLEALPLPALQTDSMASAACALHLLTSPRADPGASGGSSDGGGGGHTAWPAAPDITRETRNSLRDNGLSDWSVASPYHRHSFHLTQNDSQDVGADQSDPDDEIASLASSSGNCGSRSSHRMAVKDWKTSPRGSPKLKRKTKKDDGYVIKSELPADGLSETQDELLMLLRTQQRELSELWSLVETMPGTIMAMVEHVLMKHQEQEQRRLDRVLAESQNHQQQLHDQLTQHLSSALSSALTNRMDKVLRDELKKTVPQRQSTAGAILFVHLKIILRKENLIKLSKSKSLYFRAFKSPAGASCSRVVTWISADIQQLESHMKSRKQREQETRDPVVGQLQQMIDSFQNSTDQLAGSVSATVRAEVQHQMQMVSGNLQESILSHVQRIVKGEVSLAMKEQQAVVTSSIMQAMRSAAGTPVPTAHLDYQTQQANILQFLQQGQLNQAFQQALSATDLNLVLYVCETVDSQQVFGQTPCPLSQPVLLSLIQQLSSNLATRSELKISYLEDAVMNLDHGDPLTRDHMSSVLAQVRPKLIAFLQQDPHSPLSKRARRLLMMLQGLVNH